MAPEPALSGTREADDVEAPWLYLITDRRRLTHAAGAPETAWGTLLQEQVRGAVRAGIRFVQIRERDLDARDLLGLTRTLVALAAGSVTRILVSDRVDVALAAGADGVHLRGDSPVPARIRPLTGPRAIVGRSVHACQDVQNAPGADYFVAGTVFPSVSKADTTEYLGTRGLIDIVRVAGMTPVLAIGGVTEATAPEVAASGARGLASIGAFLPIEGQRDVARGVERQAERIRRAFSRAARDL